MPKKIMVFISKKSNTRVEFVNVVKMRTNVVKMNALSDLFTKFPDECLVLPFYKISKMREDLISSNTCSVWWPKCYMSVHQVAHHLQLCFDVPKGRKCNCILTRYKPGRRKLSTWQQQVVTQKMLITHIAWTFRARV